MHDNYWRFLAPLRSTRPSAEAKYLAAQAGNDNYGDSNERAERENNSAVNYDSALPVLSNIMSFRTIGAIG